MHCKMAAFFIIFAMKPSHRHTLPWALLDSKPSSSHTQLQFCRWRLKNVLLAIFPVAQQQQQNRAHRQFVGRLKNVTSCLEERTRVCTRTAAVIQDVEMLKQPQHLRLGILIAVQPSTHLSAPRKIDSRHTSQCSRALKTTLAWWGRGRAVDNKAATLSRYGRDVVNLEMLLFHSIPWRRKRPNANNVCRRTSGKMLPVAFDWPQPCVVHTSAVVLKKLYDWRRVIVPWLSLLCSVSNYSQFLYSVSDDWALVLRRRR